MTETKEVMSGEVEKMFGWPVMMNNKHVFELSWTQVSD
jgi:hypothetical protein